MKQQDIADLTYVSYQLALDSKAPILRREKISSRLLSLFKADFLGQTQWNFTTNNYEKPVCYNRDDDMSFAYETYYQYCDPIAKKLQNSEQVHSIFDVICAADLYKTEYYNDFLKPFRVSHGIHQNLFKNGQNIGDFRIWRRSKMAYFTKREKGLLDALKPMLANAMFNMPTGAELESHISNTAYLKAAISADHKKYVLSAPLIKWLEDDGTLNEVLFTKIIMRALSQNKTAMKFKKFNVDFNWRLVGRESECAVICHVTPNEIPSLGIAKHLTQREEQVNKLILAGHSDKQISEVLKISFWTVRSHVGNILRKKQAKNRFELLAYSK